MKIALTGGGTLGHVIPALSVAAAIKSNADDAFFIYIGSRKENERRCVEDRGITFFPISTGKLRRYFSLENIADIFRLVHGFFSALAILRREKPDVLFSKGGYVSVPVVLAAYLLGIPSITHESDMSLGLANRINSRFSKKVCLGFDSIKGEKYVYTGNPVREDILNEKKDPYSKPFILILGGSQGAKSLNELVYAHLDELLALAPVVHQAGRFGDFSIKRDGYRQVEFISKELAYLVRNAALVISRSGANAVTEFLAAESVVVLVPLRTNASRGDQVENAAFLENRGAAMVASETDFMSKVASAFKDDKLRNSLVSNGRSLIRRDAATNIAKIVIDSIGVR